ncbi:MAG: hypothetical protein SFY92_12005 [Verrucomicrobiae bacterium]|nr:hypothetical protein [Verrucomicrobiae bacterium]
MGNFRHFVDKVTGCIFKTVVLTILVGGGYFLWNGWGDAATPEEERAKVYRAAYEEFKTAKGRDPNSTDKFSIRKKIDETKYAAGFAGAKTMFMGIDEQLMNAQSESEKSTNVNNSNREKTDQ